MLIHLNAYIVYTQCYNMNTPTHPCLSLQNINRDFQHYAKPHKFDVPHLYIYNTTRHIYKSNTHPWHPFRQNEKKKPKTKTRNQKYHFPRHFSLGPNQITLICIYYTKHKSHIFIKNLSQIKFTDKNFRNWFSRFFSFFFLLFSFSSCYPFLLRSNIWWLYIY